jgi:putative membrane protein
MLRRAVPWLLGLALLAAVAHWQDFAWDDARGAFARAGVGGVLLIAAFHLLPLVVDAQAWRLLLPADVRVSLLRISVMRWIGEAAALLPAAQIGGELMRVRAMTLGGIAAPIVGASVLVDVTLGVVTQIVFSLAGVAALVAIAAPGSGDLVLRASAGVAVMAALIAAFIVVQRAAPFGRLARLSGMILGGERLVRVMGGADRVDREIASCYARRRTLLASALWRLTGWIVGIGEFWIGLALLGHPIGLLEAIMLESMVQAVRSAAFFVPVGLGVQEATLVALGAAIGVPAEAAIGVSLLKRARELILGLPGLAAWWWLERRRA